MKGLRKFLCILLALIMMFSVSSAALAAETQEQYPIVYVPGIWSSDICEDKNDPTTKITFPDSEEIAQIVATDIAPALIAYAADRNIDTLAQRICATLNEILDGLYNNPDGTAKGNAGVYMPYPSATSIKNTSFLVFNYDWRGDPFVSAAQLNDFIEYVCESSGCDKVALASHSLGSVTILTYLTVYGDSRISGIVYDTPVIDGVSYVGELLCGDMAVSGDSIIAFIKAIMGSNEYEALVSSVLDALALSGFSDLLGESLDGLLDRIAPTLYKETVVPLFCSWPTIWAMSPPEKIDEGMDYIFNNIYKNEDFSVLEEKIEMYNKLVRNNRHDTLLSFDENGKMAVIARYGYSSLPVTEKWANISDTVVDTSSNSLGATTAKFGDYFDDAYLEGKDMKYISPDKTIDASTCLFPEKTWFIKNTQHSETAYTTVLYRDFLFSSDEVTCDSSELSRFSYLDRDNNEITVDTSEPQKIEKKSPFEILIDFIRAIIEKILGLFKK